jgi:hypothetical protein
VAKSAAQRKLHWNIFGAALRTDAKINYAGPQRGSATDRHPHIKPGE